MEEDNDLVCQDCGTKEKVTKTTCPYAYEIYGEEVEIVVCDECYRERWWDI